MQNRPPTETLLDAQDLGAALDFRARPLLATPRPTRGERPKPVPHDFLALTLHPDLTPECADAGTGGFVYSCDRNIPQK